MVDGTGGLWIGTEEAERAGMVTKFGEIENGRDAVIRMWPWGWAGRLERFEWGVMSWVGVTQRLEKR